MNASDILAKVSLFSRMKKEELDQLATCVQFHHFGPGDVIIHEGDRDTRLFIIEKGTVDVIINLGQRGERHLKRFGPYSYFGEMALIDDLVRSASVVAKEETDVVSLDKLNLFQEIEKCPAMAVELLQMLSRRVRAVEMSMMNTLGGLIPICSNCKRIKDEEGVWTVIETYIAAHSEAEFSHSICPTCARALYSDYYTGDE
jgi:CRP-like cAMP-binding protein